MLAAILNVSHLVETFGYPLLFLLVMAESSGVPVPGETALITAAVLASQGKLQIELVIALAAAGGDRRRQHRLPDRPQGRTLAARTARALPPPAPAGARARASRSSRRHGPKAVFFGRFVLGLRVWASWLAGATHMHWRSFVLWNALGGICWATAIGLLAYFLGHAAGNAIETFGIYGLVAVLVAVGERVPGSSRHRRRCAESRASRARVETPEPPASEP